MDSLKELREWFLEDPETRSVRQKVEEFPTKSAKNWPGSFGTNCCRVFLLEIYRRRDGHG